jgi:Predicted transcriptional regulator
MNNNITDAEWEVMKVIWNNPPITSNEIVKVLKTEMQWQDSTIYTLINRLVKKKMIAIEKGSSPYMCHPLVSQQDCRREERISFIKKVYNGSLNLMLAHMIEDEELTENDIDELKKILDKKDKRG